MKWLVWIEENGRWGNVEISNREDEWYERLSSIVLFDEWNFIFSGIDREVIIVVIDVS